MKKMALIIYVICASLPLYAQNPSYYKVIIIDKYLTRLEAGTSTYFYEDREKKKTSMIYYTTM